MFDFERTETPGNRILNFLDTFHTIPSEYYTGTHNENLLKLSPTLMNTANLRYAGYTSLLHTKQTNKLRDLSPRANYTDRAAAAGRRS